jgi:hypothetical protein
VAVQAADVVNNDTWCLYDENRWRGCQIGKDNEMLKNWWGNEQGQEAWVQKRENEYWKWNWMVVVMHRVKTQCGFEQVGWGLRDTRPQGS